MKCNELDTKLASLQSGASAEGRHLLARRKELGLTQQEVADLAHVALRQYQRFESGERALSSSSLRIALAICDALRLDPHCFVEPSSSDN